ncbi:uncharacterized protein LOC129947257 [Eupeodes corollae]|uniref:uncharacterized protein LOC129947257 n=1 Tax=Eupeodes corollae TaxID=290404 RepID=UPI00249382D5|nr:uncharacterized protein LOC129947257 [Eupeodes corollae]
MANNRLPIELDCSNLVKEWPMWKRTFLMFMMANGKMDEGEPTKIANFLWLIGPRAMEIYNTLFPNDGTLPGIVGNEQNPEEVAEGEEAPPNIERTLNDVLQAFDNYCVPLKNVTMESFKYNTIVQREKQPFAEFETELRKQIQYCEFKCHCGASYEERMLRDRIIIGIADKKLQLKLLDGRNESLKTVVDTCKVFEAAYTNKKLLETNQQQQVHHVTSEQPTLSDSINAISRHCYNCGHQPFSTAHLRECKANNIVCSTCGKKGHFSKWCKRGSNNKMGSKTENKKLDNKLDKKAVKALSGGNSWIESDSD